jgi:hypothetical protein
VGRGLQEIFDRFEPVTKGPYLLGLETLLGHALMVPQVSDGRFGSTTHEIRAGVPPSSASSARTPVPLRHQTGPIECSRRTHQDEIFDSLRVTSRHWYEQRHFADPIQRSESNARRHHL